MLTLSKTFLLSFFNFYKYPRIKTKFINKYRRHLEKVKKNSPSRLLIIVIKYEQHNLPCETQKSPSTFTFSIKQEHTQFFLKIKFYSPRCLLVECYVKKGYILL